MGLESERPKILKGSYDDKMKEQKRMYDGDL